MLTTAPSGGGQEVADTLGNLKLREIHKSDWGKYRTEIGGNTHVRLGQIQNGDCWNTGKRKYRREFFFFFKLALI